MRNIQLVIIFMVWVTFEAFETYCISVVWLFFLELGRQGNVEIPQAMHIILPYLPPVAVVGVFCIFLFFGFPSGEGGGGTWLAYMHGWGHTHPDIWVTFEAHYGCSIVILVS